MKYNRVVVFLAVLFCALSAGAQLMQRPKPVDAADEPFHSLLLENDHVRVFKVEIPPYKQTQVYMHEDDFVRIALGNGEAAFGRPETMPMTREFDDGYTQFVPGGFAEVVKSTSSVRTFRMIEVELKDRKVKPPSVYDYSSAVAQMYDSIPLPVDPRASYVTSLEAYSVIGADQQLVAGDLTPMHAHRGPHLVVALTEIELENQPKSGEPRAVKMQAGDVAWVTEPSPHRLKNVGEGPARRIVLEMK